MPIGVRKANFCLIAFKGERSSSQITNRAQTRMEAGCADRSSSRLQHWPCFPCALRVTATERFSRFCESAAPRQCRSKIGAGWRVSPRQPTPTAVVNQTN